MHATGFQGCRMKNVGPLPPSLDEGPRVFGALDAFIKAVKGCHPLAEHVVSACMNY